MGKITNLFRRPKQVMIWSPLAGIVPGVSNGHGKWTDDVMVQACIDSIATEMSKLQPHHVRIGKTGESTVEDDAIERVLKRPNYLMTMSDMLEKLVWNLYMTSNAWVLPEYDMMGNNLIALWPVPRASKTEVIIDPDGTEFIRFTFPGNDGGKDEVVTLRYDSIIHIRRQYSMNDYLGGDEQGKPNVKGLNKALNANNDALDAIGKNVSISSGITGIIKAKTKIGETSLVETQEAFKRVMDASNTGIVAVDNSIEYTPIERKPAVVSADTTKYLQTRILEYFGVPACILSGDYTKAQYEAFYQKTLEPLCIKFSQAFTKVLFSNRENASYGNCIRFYQSELIFMTIAQKLELARLLGDRGIVFENQILDMFGLPPVPELEGIRMQSLNYINVKDATEYQKSRNGLKKSDEDPDQKTENKEE